MDTSLLIRENDQNTLLKQQKDLPKLHLTQKILFV